MKTLALDEIYANPHKLDSFLLSGEPVAVTRDGRAVAEFVPQKESGESGSKAIRPQINFRDRFLKMWGPDAFQNNLSISEQFEELRRQREL